MALAVALVLAAGRAPPARGAAATPPDPLALRAAWAARVSTAGMQQITGAALAAAGMDLARVNPARLQLWLRGQPVPLEEIGTGDGRLDPADALRFYAPPPGDRWNSGDTYWLSVEAGAGARMAQRPAPASSAPACPGAEERGTLGSPAIYASRHPGDDGDHWFIASLQYAPGLDVWAGGAISSRLPAASGPASLTVGGSVSGPGPHHLLIALGPARAERRWSGAGAWSFTLPAWRAASDGPPAVQISAGPQEADDLLIDRVAWSLPVTLQLGGRAGEFSSLAGAGLCQLQGLPQAAALYDIGQPLSPLRVALSAERLISAGSYLVVGAADLLTPSVAARAPADLARLARADQIYIAPAGLIAALQPLVAQRRQQGYQAQVIDVQQIYDAWSGGATDPAAIRAMLRWAAATWQPPPRAVTLVGDGTSDPHDYTRRGTPNLIPPFLAMVDPYIGETACESCFVQLDGDGPLDDPRPDLLLGRLPVKSAAELRDVVAKIIGYETSAGGLDWRGRAVLLADNAIEADGKADPAGDFGAMAERVIGLWPAEVQVERIYYDPTAGAAQPGRERDAPRAHARTLAALRAGAGLVTYIGHAHYWQWASTDPSGPAPALLGLLDVDTLDNGGRLPVVLSMACLSSAFQQPSYSGTTIDEWLLLHPGGGAVAVWGSAGLGVLSGHEELLRGFSLALWRGGDTTPVGELVYAGYAELLASQPCCADAIWTFVLLGDPLMPARAIPAQHTWLPLVARGEL